MDASARIAALRMRLVERGLDAFIARDVSNVTFLTGFDGVWDSEPSSLVLLTASRVCVLTDSRFKEAATAAAADSLLEVVVAPASVWSAAVDIVEQGGASGIAVEDSLPWSVVEQVREQMPVLVTPVAEWIEELRAVKDDVEISRITAAQALTDRAFDHILGFVREGMSETQIALELEFFLRAHGSEGVAFDPIVASGPNSALPHAKPGSRCVRRGDFLKMDFGARVDGYCADMTRTVVVGKATEQQREIYACVLAANLAGIEAVAAGRPGTEIDAAARAVIESAGYGECFGHGLGHGVGLDVHEAPSVGPRGTRPVREGSVITIEPGIYIPGLGGVRIEDLIVVESDRARVLTRSTKDLVEL